MEENDILYALDGPWLRFPGIRIANQGPNVRAWQLANGKARTTWDLCLSCFWRLERNPHRYDQLLRPEGRGEPDGTQGRGKYPWQPWYSDEAECFVCGCRLSNV